MTDNDAAYARRLQEQEYAQYGQYANRQNAQRGVSTGYLVTFVWSLLGFYYYGENGEAYCPEDLSGWHFINWTVSLGAFCVSLFAVLIARCSEKCSVALEGLLGGGCGIFLFVRALGSTAQHRTRRPPGSLSRGAPHGPACARRRCGTASATGGCGRPSHASPCTRRLWRS